MRTSLEGKGQAVDGDVTTTGAVCIATGAGYLDEGRMVLREGDGTTECPLCGQEGRVAEGVDHFISDGRRVAMDGALVACGCPPGSNRVVAPLDEAFPPLRPLAGRANSHSAAPSAAVYPERFSQPVAGALPGTLEPGFYVVPRRMSFAQVLLQLAEHDATMPRCQSPGCSGLTRRSSKASRPGKSSLSVTLIMVMPAPARKAS